MEFLRVILFLWMGSDPETINLGWFKLPLSALRYPRSCQQGLHYCSGGSKRALKPTSPTPTISNASELVQSQHTVLQVYVQTNKSRYELDWNWMGENEIKMREWERWEIDEIHFIAQRVMLALLHVCKWTHLKEVGGQFTFHSAP